MLPTDREKNVQLLSTEVRATQQNSRYSAKNNVAMRVRIITLNAAISQKKVAICIIKIEILPYKCVNTD